MKIAWLINLYPPYIMGGNEVVAKDIILELRARGHEVYLLTGHGKRFPEEPYHLTPVNFDLDLLGERFLGERVPSISESFRWHIFDLETYRETIDALRQTKHDLTVVDNFSLISVAPLLAAIRARSKVVVQANDKWLIYGLKRAGEGLWQCPQAQRPLIAFAQRLLQPIFSRIAQPVPIIVNSHFMRDTYVRAGFEAERVKVVHLGIDVDLFCPNTNRSETGMPIRLMFASQLWEGKGPQVAIRALAELKEQAPETPFILDVYGEGQQAFRDSLDALARKLGVSDSVQYRGYVSPTELAEAARTHDIFLFTPIWDEPFSLTLLSMMSCGIPVIATSAGGNSEAIEDEHTGLLVPPGEPLALAKAILRLARDLALRSRLSAQAAAAVQEKWSFKHYVDTLESLYHACAAG